MMLVMQQRSNSTRKKDLQIIVFNILSKSYVKEYWRALPLGGAGSSVPPFFYVNLNRQNRIELYILFIL